MRPSACGIRNHIDDPQDQTVLTSNGEICLPASFDTTGRFLLAQGPAGDARVWDIARQERLPAAEDYFSPFGMTVFGGQRNALAMRSIQDWVTAAVRQSPSARRISRTDRAPSGFWPSGLITLSAAGALHSIAQFSDDGNTLLVGSWNGPGEYQYWRPPTWAEIKAVEDSGQGWRQNDE